MKRLFYLFILMGVFTVTQPGCGLLFFPFPDMDTDDDIVEVEEDDGGGLLFPVDDPVDDPAVDDPAVEDPAVEDPAVEEPADEEPVDDGEFDGPDLDPLGDPIPDDDELLFLT